MRDAWWELHPAYDDLVAIFKGSTASPKHLAFLVIVGLTRDGKWEITRAEELGRLRRELRGVRESLAERAQALEDSEATVAMYRARLVGRGDRVVPDWAVPVLGPAESSLRVLDAIRSRSLAGESRESVADDYGVSVEFVDLVRQQWTIR